MDFQVRNLLFLLVPFLGEPCLTLGGYRSHLGWSKKGTIEKKQNIMNKKSQKSILNLLMALLSNDNGRWVLRIGKWSSFSNFSSFFSSNLGRLGKSVIKPSKTLWNENGVYSKMFSTSSTIFTKIFLHETVCLKLFEYVLYILYIYENSSLIIDTLFKCISNNFPSTLITSRSFKPPKKT